MRIRLDPTIPGPLFEQLASSLRASVVDGRVAFGERLPAARELASALEVNVHTVLRAYRVLRDEGLIELHPGRGAVVAKRLGHHTALAGAIIVAEKLRASIASVPMMTLAGAVSATASIGLASLESLAADKTPPTLDNMLDLADRCLSESKAEGRNRVTVPRPR